jgi:hypothetical protein
MLYTCLDVPEAAFVQMLTLEILHVCRQIDEYTHLIASIKAQVKLVCTIYYNCLGVPLCRRSYSLHSK